MRRALRDATIAKPFRFACFSGLAKPQMPHCIDPSCPPDHRRAGTVAPQGVAMAYQNDATSMRSTPATMNAPNSANSASSTRDHGSGNRLLESFSGRKGRCSANLERTHNASDLGLSAEALLVRPAEGGQSLRGKQ